MSVQHNQIISEALFRLCSTRNGDFMTINDLTDIYELFVEIVQIFDCKH